VQPIVQPAVQSAVQLALQLVRCFSTLSFVSLIFPETFSVLVHALNMIQHKDEDRISRTTVLFVDPFSSEK
jgi:hypothetical protein